MSKEPATDCYSMIGRVVENHMKPFIEASMLEHELTRKKIDENTKLVRKVADSDGQVVRDVIMAIMFIGMVLLFSTCI